MVFRALSNLRRKKMEIENSEFYFYMFKLISTPNRMTMKRLVYNGYISYNQLQLEVMELFYQLYQTPIECRIFRHVLNSHLSSYLQCVINECHGLTPSIPKPTTNWNPVLIHPYGYILCKMPVKVEISSALSEEKVSTEKSTNGLFNSNSNIFDKRVIDNQKVEQEIPVNVNASDCNVSFSSEKKNDNEQLSVHDLQSFLFPLQQDYTKSSKGYSCQSKHDKTELKTALNLCSNNFQKMEEPISNNDSNTSDDEFYDPAQNLIISRYLNSLNSSSSESEVSYNEICCDSDSDDSIVFSENIENTQGEVVFDKFKRGTSKKIELDIFSYDSDSDDSVEFLENFDSKCLEKSSKANMKNTKEDNLDSETINSDLFERYDNAFSFSLHQNLNSSFRKNDEFSDSSFSLSQDKMIAYSTDFGGFSNPCFIDDDVSSWFSLKNINDKWEDSMKDISCEPREPKRVSFVPVPDLVSVQMFEPDEDNYRYSIFVLDQIRFKNRIQEFEEVIKPYLSPGHREKVYQCFNSNNDLFPI